MNSIVLGLAKLIGGAAAKYEQNNNTNDAITQQTKTHDHVEESSLQEF